MTKVDYYLKCNNLLEMPKCKYSECNNRVELNGYEAREFCSVKCHKRHAYYDQGWRPHNILNGTNPFLKENRIDENGINIIGLKSTKARHENHTFTNSSKDINPNKMSTIYIGLFKKENLIKIGRSRNINKRLLCYYYGGIEFDSKCTFTDSEDKIALIEKELILKYNSNTKYLDINKYPNPDKSKSIFTLGHTEWFDSVIWNDLLSDFNKLTTN